MSRLSEIIKLIIIIYCSGVIQLSQEDLIPPTLKVKAVKGITFTPLHQKIIYQGVHKIYFQAEWEIREKVDINEGVKIMERQNNSGVGIRNRNVNNQNNTRNNITGGNVIQNNSGLQNNNRTRGNRQATLEVTTTKLPVEATTTRLPVVVTTVGSPQLN